MKHLKKGYVQIYTGDGKGKTSAALGLAVRAAGRGLTTYMGQFMKGRHYGELTSLQPHPHITIEQYGDTDCIRREDVTPVHLGQAAAGLKKADNAMRSGRYNILILDEIIVAVWFGLLAETEVIRFLENRIATVEIVLTGRKASEKLMASADLVSEIKEVKHYYHSGITAREGIER